MKPPPLGPGGDDITWPDQVAPRGRKMSSTRNVKPPVEWNLREGAVAHMLVVPHHAWAPSLRDSNI